MYRHSLSRIFKLLSSVITLLVFSGCADDLRNRNIFDSGAGDAVIRFSVENVVLTRDGEAQDMESIVDHAYLLFYADDASIDTGVPIAAVRADVDADYPGVLKFKMPLRLQPNTDYQLLAIANADNYVPAGFNNFGEYLESWYGKSSETEYSPMLLYRSVPITTGLVENLPMSGGVVGNSIFRFSMDNGAYNVSASLSFRRKVARIDVANIVKEGFKVEGVLLCNWRDAVVASSSDTMLGDRAGSVHGVFSADDVSDDKFIMMPDADDSGIQQLNKMLYCFPSISYDSYMGDNESTALIIKAKYGSDAQSTYYRINVGLDGNVSKVKANTKYLVTIQSVKGSGAPTPEEAYTASESPIVLSVVEDWDLEGSNFAMDDNGNFIVVSRSSIEFEGNVTDNIEIGVLTSKGLSWTAEYIPDNEESTSAFNVTSISNSIFIGPKSTNETDNAFSGKCRVSAITSYGDNLIVDVALTQKVAEDIPFEPVIPEDMPFALIPDSYDRVKIDHENRTIEIDGFDPDCFNSFIDIPFKVYINESESDVSEVTVTSTLEWPLEGRISTNESNGYTYCQETFTSLGKVYSPYGSLTTIEKISSSLRLQDKDVFYISVGAMGPDDPAIVNRKIELTANGESITYALTIQPRPAIIDDVVLIDSSGEALLVQDRNIQDSTSMIYVGEDGKKYQAYNYSRITSNIKINIPFKFSAKDINIDEEFHLSCQGMHYTIINKNNIGTTDKQDGDRFIWLKRISDDLVNKTSPFFESDNFEAWILPNEFDMETMRSKVKVSKMRMYFVSDVPVKSGKKDIPVCCYLPYLCLSIGDLSNMTNGYYFSEDGSIPTSIKIFYFDRQYAKCEDPEKVVNYSPGYVRLVRRLTSEELISYKNNYLGYGSQPHKLILCHPDTYTSEGWLAK